MSEIYLERLLSLSKKKQTPVLNKLLNDVKLNITFSNDLKWNVKNCFIIDIEKIHEINYVVIMVGTSNRHSGLIY